tara:strand:- start:187 stop:2097 length:1911 start_codon:yes stop_codon:yes gene_type:complete
MAMARTIDINIENNAMKSSKDFEDLADGVGKVDDQVKDLNKNSKGAVGGFKKMGTAAKGLGTAFKAAGIGLVVAGLVALKEAFSSNQETANKFSEVMETISIVFQKTVGAIIDAVKATSEANGGFKALGKVMGGIIDLALAPFQAAFFGIKLGVLEAQLIWEKSVFGSGDVTEIKRLNKAIDETQESLIGVGTSVLEAGGEIINNLGAAIDEVTTLTTAAVENVKKISITAANEQAKALVAARNAAAIAAAEQSRLVEIYDRQAEQQRQIRDEERNSIPERIKANEALKEVLEKQEKAMLAQADLQVRSAQLEFNRNKTTETQIALTEALANREGVLAQVEGFRSEQLANDLALNRELIELTNTQSESEATLAIERKKATNEQLENESVKLENKRKLLEEEREIELARLQLIIDSANAGTQAKVDAEIEFNTKKQELDLEALSVEKEINKQKIADAKAVADAEKAIRDAQFANIEAGIGLAKSLFGDNKKLQAAALIAENAVGIAKTIINTQAANAAAIAQGTALSVATAGASVAAATAAVVNNNISAGISVAASVAATAKGLSALGGGGNPGGGDVPTGGGSGGGGSAPNFNVVGDSGVNQLASLQTQPTKTFVVSGEVTTAQALDRNRVQNATL